MATKITFIDPQDFPANVANNWQAVVDLIVRMSGVKVGLVMQVVSDKISVCVSSNSPNNPYKVGDSEHLAGSGLYCETVIKSGEHLLVSDALSDPLWDQNPDLKFGLVSYLGFPIRLPDGSVFGTLCVLDDKENRYTSDIIELMIQMRALIEAQLRLLDENKKYRLFAKESLLRRILDSLPVAVICASAQTDVIRPIYRNHKYYELSGDERSDDLPLQDSLRLFADTNGSATQRDVSVLVTQLLQPDSSSAHEEWRLKRSDGSLVDVLLSATLIDEIILIALVDISEQKAHEELHRERKARLNLVLSASGLGLWDWDMVGDHIFLDARSLSLIGTSTAPHSFAEWEATIHPDDRSYMRNRIQGHINGDLDSYEVEYRQRHHHGHWVWILDRGRIVSRDASGQALRMAGTYQDISARKRIESESESLLRQIAGLMTNAINQQHGVISDTQKTIGKAKINSLTRRQTQILRLVASGLTSQEIASSLNISADTVDTHRRDLMRKLEVRSIAALTKLAIDAGLV